jgi:hypothetical protein
MITGFNTDVEHEGVVYHVQTEDKGLASPLVLSLVYSGGAILAVKRSSYEDLIAAGFEEAALAERLQRQHRLICAAIRAGRIDELKRMRTPQAATATPETARPVTTAEPSATQPPKTTEIAQTQPPQTEVSGSGGVTGSLSDSHPALPKKAEVSPYTVYDSRRRSPLGELIEEPEGLRITLLDHDPDFHGGEDLELRLVVTRVSQQVETAVNGAALAVKVLGTTFRPVLVSLKTDREGLAKISTHLPSFTSGRAAIVIRATASDLSTEARWVVHPRK